jgi:Flp pilus assembly protein TadB
MRVFRFLAGILIVQIISVALVLLARPPGDDWAVWMPIIVALSAIGLVAAFWFAHVASHLRRDEIERMRIEFAHEREQLRVKAERDKTRVIKKSHKTIVTETRRAEARANLKVGVAVSAAAGIGLLMVMTNLMTLGLLMMTAAGGALSGYLLRRNWVQRLSKPAESSHRRIRNINPS